jgi:hypothetical protein
MATSCRPYLCQSSAGLYQDHVDNGRVMTYGCDDHGGASGGPVFAKVGDVCVALRGRFWVLCALAHVRCVSGTVDGASGLADDGTEAAGPRPPGTKGSTMFTSVVGARVPRTGTSGAGRGAKLLVAVAGSAIALSSMVVADVSGTVDAGGSGVVSLTPARLLETRSGASTVDGGQQGIGRRGAGSTVEVVVAGRGGVPKDAAAVMLNVTAVKPGRAGFLTVYPCGEQRPNASNLNYGVGGVVANAVLSKVGKDGKVCVFTLADADIVVDVNGAFTGGSGVVSLTPARLLETRSGASTVDGGQQGIGRRGAGSTVEVVVAGRGGVPKDAAAVMLNVTAVKPGRAGFLTVYPCGEQRPNASNLNYGVGGVVANAVLSKVGKDGKVCVFTLADADIVVDVNGAFTGGSGVVSLTPARLLETRSGASTVDGGQQGIGRRGAGSTVEVVVAGRGGVPKDAAAVMLNVTAVKPGRAGFLTVYPCGEQRPNASNLNYGVGGVVANAVLSKVGKDGKVCVFTLADADIVVDVNGAFTNTLSQDPVMPPSTPPNGPSTPPSGPDAPPSGPAAPPSGPPSGSDGPPSAPSVHPG